MAYFAELDENNLVLRVVGVGNEITTIDGVEVEQRGIDFLTDLLPGSGPWVQTSFNSNRRREYANVGMAYDPTLDVFYGTVHPIYCSSYIFDDVTKTWEPPTPRPGEAWWWDDEAVKWVKGFMGCLEYPPWDGSVWDDDTGWDLGDPDWSLYPGSVDENGWPSAAPYFTWNDDTSIWVAVDAE